MNNLIHYQLTHPSARCISKSSGTSAAFDIYTPDRHVVLPKDIKTINTGFRCELHEDTFAMIVGRSKLATKGLIILGGIIDSDYRGDWIVCCSNISETHITFDAGDAIAQVLILPVMQFEMHLVHKLSETKRGASGILDADKRK